MNQYITIIEKVNNSNTFIKNMIEERESVLFRLKAFTQSNDLSKFEKIAPQIMLLLRHCTQELVKGFKSYTKFLF